MSYRQILLQKVRVSFPKSDCESIVTAIVEEHNWNAAMRVELREFNYLKGFYKSLKNHPYSLEFSKDLITLKKSFDSIQICQQIDLRLVSSHVGRINIESLLAGYCESVQRSVKGLYINMGYRVEDGVISCE